MPTSHIQNDPNVVPSVSIYPGAESSVEITTNSKGESQLTVKVYHEQVDIAMTTALAMYEEGLLQLIKIKAKVDKEKG